jgi:endonuclease-3 related protein
MLTVPGVIAALEAMHGHREWHWWPEKPPFEVCVGAILVQNTAWTNVERALERLRDARALDPARMAALSDAELELLVRPSGQYRQKARKLRAFLATCSGAGGLDRLLALPAAELRSRLLQTWGIGPETADCIVCYAGRQPALVVDAYTARLFRRLGMGPAAEGYSAWQEWLVSSLPAVTDERAAERYARVHALVVLHAKHLCRKRNPRCGACLLRGACTVPDANDPRLETGGPMSQTEQTV